VVAPRRPACRRAAPARACRPPPETGPIRRIAPILAILATALPAHAQDQAALERFVVHEAHQACDLTDLHIVHRGPLPGLDGTAVVARYGVEGCLGGNNSLQTFGVFRRDHGRIRLWRPEMPREVSVDDARVEAGRIIVTGQAWVAGDARCCPSLPVTLGFAMRNGRLVPLPGAQ
jgi:hypothetical protein